MGFDELLHQDRCYLKVGDTHEDGMNIKIIDDTLCQGFQGTHSITEGKRNVSYTQSNIEDLLKIKSNMDETNKNSDQDIPKIVYFSPPIEYCSNHSNLFMVQDDKLVHPGDKFGSHDDFIQYLNVNATRWLYYYICSDSQKRDTEYETYTYNCVYVRRRETNIKIGLRNKHLKIVCPCKIKLRRLPNEKELTAVYVCNHHNHRLSEKEFHKLQHGKLLSPHMKEEIMDLLTLQVDARKIRKHVLMETGFNMSLSYFNTIEKNMKSKYMERKIPVERLKRLSKIISVIEDTYVFDDDNTIDEIIKPSQSVAIHSEPVQQSTVENTSTQLTETTRNSLSSLKRRPIVSINLIEETSKRSNLDISFQISTNDSGTMQSIDMQESVRCDTQENPWTIDECVPILPNSIIHSGPIEPIHVSIIKETNEAPLDKTLINSCDIIDDTVLNSIHDVNELNDQQNAIISNCIVYEMVGDIEYICEDDVTCENNDQNLESFENTQICEKTKDIVNNLDNDRNENGSMTNNETYEAVVRCEDEEEAVENVCEGNDANDTKTACDAEVQTCSTEVERSYVPVFDVHMKDGNVTGFILNNSLINKGVEEKGVQINEDMFNTSNTPTSEDEDMANTVPNIIEEVELNVGSGDLYTKHEYIHKYNIEQYMVQRKFPNYIEKLSNEKCMTVLQMFTDIYNEKAMLKMTTTQNGKKSHTKMVYLTEPHRPRKNKGCNYADKINRIKFGKNLKEIYVLREKTKALKKRNYELLTRNKYLEDIAHHLVKDGVVRFETV